MTQGRILTKLIDYIAFVVCNKKLRKFLRFAGNAEKSTRGRPEIDRLQLRQFLLRSLNENTVKWSSKLRSIDEKDGKFTLNFDHGKESGFDLVVGADGAWSKVRAVLSEAKPFYTGIGGFHWSIRDPKENCPEQYALVNRGSMFAFSDGKSLFAQQISDGSLGCSFYGVMPENWQKEVTYDINNGEAVRTAMLDQYETWAPTLKGYVEALDTKSTMPRNIYMLPIGHKWDHKPGVTLLGDAAHLMSPFAGEGVNFAMQDALDLSEAIIASAKSGDKGSLDARVRKFEDAMFKRSKKVAQITFNMMTLMFFTPGAPDTTIEKWMCTAATAERNPILGAGITIGVYTFYFFFRLFGLGGGEK